jgi:antitoxin FitA
MEPVMGVNLSIKNVPVEKVALLKQRAKANHRSLQGELMAIIEQAAQTSLPDRKRGKLSVDELVAKLDAHPVTRVNEAVRMIREDRDR